MTHHSSSRIITVKLPDNTTVSVTTAMQAAMQHHQAGRLRRAQAIYNLVLQAAPNNVDALHLLGLVTRQFGNHEIAVGLINQAIKLNPNVAMFHNNLAETYRVMDRPDEAIAHCKKALALQPDFSEAYYNLAMALRMQGKLDEAIACFEQAIRGKPGFIEAHAGLGETLHKQGRADEALATYRKALHSYPDNPTLLSSMGIALRTLGRVDEAIAHYKKAIAVRPDIPELHNNLGVIYKAQGKLSEAAACFRQVLELRPNDGSARHLLNALQQQTTDCAPRGYVQETFDNYAQGFDKHLAGKLEYRVPEIMGKAIKTFLAHNSQKMDILDLGCGTGLVGVELREISRRLVGIDLSPKMIAKARERGVYDQLVVGDVLDHMTKLEQDTFDLVTSADVFVYIGNLHPVFEHCRRILCPGGLFAFSLEALPDENRDFVLAATGRYQQSRAYIGKLSQHFGFIEVHFTPIHVRKEQDQPVNGYIYLLRKQAN